MSQTNPKSCPFDWQDGSNNTLSGGRLLEVKTHLFAYAFYGEGTGQFERALIAGTTHGGTMSSLLTGYPDELAAMFEAVLGELHGDPYNVSGNVGFIAGVRVENHPHLHVIRRYADEPASSWGLNALIDKYNTLVRSVRSAPQHGLWDGGT